MPLKAIFEITQGTYQNAVEITREDLEDCNPKKALKEA
tara:strand:- start:9602 stop:9715 length:114 start_codon:yes stop_codon:yes gene_type:complete